MRHLAGFAFALALTASPLGASAQRVEEDGSRVAESHPEAQLDRLKPVPDPTLRLDLNPAGLEMTTAVSRNTESDDTNEHRARSGLAASAIGLVLSTVGLGVGTSLMFYSFDCPAIGGPLGTRCLEDGLAKRDQRQRVGTAMISVSVVGFGASLFGLVRTKIKLNRAYPKQPREPASWR